jgi:predicted transcriptional regulator
VKKKNEKARNKLKLELRTYESISRETGRDRRTVRRILDAAQIKPGDDGALEFVKQAGDTKDLRKNPNSPAARISMAEADLVERRNRIAQKLEDETYIEVEAMDKLLRLLIGKLEVIPTKMQSEFGVPDKQTKRLRELLDECRQEASKEILK